MTSAPRSAVPASARGAISGDRHAALLFGSARFSRTRTGACSVTAIRSVAERVRGRGRHPVAAGNQRDPDDDDNDSECDPDPAEDHADIAQVAVGGLPVDLRLLALLSDDYRRDAGGQTDASHHDRDDAEDQSPGAWAVLLGATHWAVAGRRHRRRLAVPAVPRSGRCRCPVRDGRWWRRRRWNRYAAGGLLWSRVRVLWTPGERHSASLTGADGGRRRAF